MSVLKIGTVFLSPFPIFGDGKLSNENFVPESYTDIANCLTDPIDRLRRDAPVMRAKTKQQADVRNKPKDTRRRRSSHFFWCYPSKVRGWLPLGISHHDASPVSAKLVRLIVNKLCPLIDTVFATSNLSFFYFRHPFTARMEPLDRASFQAFLKKRRTSIDKQQCINL